MEKIEWICTTRVAILTGMGSLKLQTWLESGNCPFGYGKVDSRGNFLSYILKKDFVKWLRENKFLGEDEDLPGDEKETEQEVG